MIYDIDDCKEDNDSKCDNECEDYVSKCDNECEEDDLFIDKYEFNFNGINEIFIAKKYDFYDLFSSDSQYVIYDMSLLQQLVSNKMTKQHIEYIINFLEEIIFHK